MDSRIKQIYNLISKKEPNYFGIFKEGLYLIQIKLCYDYYNIIIREPVDIVAYCFWNKHFNLKEQIAWTIFENSFKTEFNIYVKDTDKFKDILCDENDNVIFKKYLELTFKYNGIYELYQKITNKNIIIYYTTQHNNKLCIDETLLGKHIVSISSGGYYGAALTNEGHLYMMGSNPYGQLGIDVIFSETFILNKYLFKNNIYIKKVVCGYAHTAAITLDNDLYIWGSGEHGRLGNDSTNNVYTPSKIIFFKNNIKDVQLGSSHTCVLTTDGKVYTFGQSYYTGTNKHNNILVPTLIDFNEEIQSISIGAGAYHTMALTASKKLYMWGHNRVGQLGFPKDNLPLNLDNASYSPIPIHIKEVDSLNIVKINGFWANSVITCEKGNIYICGKISDPTQLKLNNNIILKTNERNHYYLDKFTKINNNVKNIYLDDKNIIFIKSGISTNKVLDISIGSNYKIFLIKKYYCNTLQNSCLNKFKHHDYSDIIKSYLLSSDKITIQSSEEIDFN